MKVTVIPLNFEWAEDVLTIMTSEEIVPGTELHGYRFGGVLGVGAFSTVYLATMESTGLDVAIKVISKSSFADPLHCRMVENELTIHQSISHPFIAEFYETFETEDSQFIVLEYVQNGSVLSYVNLYGPLPEEFARNLFIELLSALSYLHNEGILHRDIKAENVLIDEGHHCKLVDFGLSQKSKSSNNRSGSPAYAPPETIKGESPTIASDVWSCGVFLFAAVTGQLPFVASDTPKLMQKILYSDPYYPHAMPPLLRDLLQKILKKEISRRLSIQEILKHPWICQSSKARELYSFRFKVTAETTAEKIMQRQEMYVQLLSLSPQCELMEKSGGDIIDADSKMSLPADGEMVGVNTRSKQPQLKKRRETAAPTTLQDKQPLTREQQLYMLRKKGNSSTPSGLRLPQQEKAFADVMQKR